MTDRDFVTYFLEALQRGVRVFPGHEYARLSRIAGEDEVAEAWMTHGAFDRCSCAGKERIALVLDSLRKAVRRLKAA